MREERKKQMLAWLDEKPKEDAADPRDLEAIEYAEANMGDYKLKSSTTYEVGVVVGVVVIIKIFGTCMAMAESFWPCYYIRCLRSRG